MVRRQLRACAGSDPRRHEERNRWCKPDDPPESVQGCCGYSCEGCYRAFKKVSGSGDIARVATVSSSDATIGKLIAEAMEKVTSDGVITVEESKTAETYSEVVEGMILTRLYHAVYGHRYR